MSNYLAIGGVSATLQALLEDRMELPEGITRAQFRVTVNSPRPEPRTEGMSEEAGVNLFLYRVAENGFLKNQELPGHGQPMAYGHPPLSLDLFYLLTPYGTTTDELTVANATRAHFLMGSAMRVFHDYPVVTESLVRVQDNAGDPILHPSLRGEVERVKLYLDPVSLEDLSKVWTALTLPFRLSAVYKVTVVQIESERTRAFAPLVGTPPAAGPRVYVTPFRTPHIRELRVRRGGASGDLVPALARVGDTLVLIGSEFGTGSLAVQIGPLEIPATPERGTRVEVAVPDTAGEPPERQLHPGPLAAAVLVGLAEFPRFRFPSNQLAFLLVPRVDLVTLGGAAGPRSLAIDGKLLHSDVRTGETIVGFATIPKVDYLAAAPDRIDVPLPDTLPGYPVATLLSGDLTTFPGLPPGPQIAVTIGAEGPHLATLPVPPASLGEVPSALQSAIREASTAAAFRGVRVTVLEDRILVVPGGLQDPVTIERASAAGGSPSDHTADDLRLTSTGGATRPEGYLGGELRPFPALTAASPHVRFTAAGADRDVPLAPRPVTAMAAAEALQVGLRAAGFANTIAGALGHQLLVVPGTPGPVRFGTVPGVDETTAAELQLRAVYPVRVRVNGAEGIDRVAVELPP